MVEGYFKYELMTDEKNECCYVIIPFSKVVWIKDYYNHLYKIKTIDGTIHTTAEKGQLSYYEKWLEFNG